MNFFIDFLYLECYYIYERTVNKLTQGERVRQLRKELDLTMEKFCKPLGVGKTAISNIENNNRNLTEQMTTSICREYGVRKEWLQDGAGEMFPELSRSESISRFFGRLTEEDDESFKKRLVEALSKLDENQWEVLEQIARDITKKD